MNDPQGNESLLARFLAGRVRGEEAGSCERKLAGSDDWLKDAEALNDDDAFVQNLRRGLGAHDDLPDLEPLIVQLCQLGGSHAREQTASQSTAESRSDNPPVRDYPFLRLPESDDELGRLGRYRVLKVLGAGGMGVVFEAEDPALKRLVALKVIAPMLAERQGYGERFLREARAAASLNHEHVVTVYEVGDDGGVHYLVMQLLRGETLQDRLKRDGPLLPSEVIRIGRQIADALDAAHGLNLLHRDIKPDNIWLEHPTGRVKVLDFGLARSIDGESPTNPGQILGTPKYMSPEQAQGGKLDARSDLFSVGAVLYRLATGVDAFQGPTLIAILRAVCDLTPPSPRQLQASMPAALSDLIMRLIQKDPAQRVASADELRAALASVEDGASPPASEGHLATDSDVASLRTLAAETTAQTTGASDEPRPTTPGWGRFARWAILMGGLVLAALFTIILLQSPQGELRIETQRDVVVRITKGDTVVKRLHAGAAGTTIKLSYGQYRVELESDWDALIVGEPAIELKRGQETVVRIQAKPNGVADDAQPTEERQLGDRELVDWALSHGAECELLVDNRETLRVQSPALPPDGNYRLVGLRLLGERKWNDADLAYIGRPPHLTELEIMSGACPITDEGLRLISSISTLEALTLRCPQVTNLGLADLSLLRHLKRLDLSLAHQITDDGLIQLGNLTALEQLKVNHGQFTEAGLQTLLNLRKLKSVDLDHLELSDAGLARMADSWDELERLAISGKDVSDMGLQVVRQFPRLQFLLLRNCTQLTPSGVATLKQAMPRCRIMISLESPMGDAGRP